MIVLRTVAQARIAIDERRRAGASIALVPTMGALHAGHRELLRAARQRCDVVVMSLFVNPAQFDAAHDLARYPRDEATDLAIAEGEGVDIVFAPSADELYPPGFDTWVDPGRLGVVLEGASRPGHFRGVATVCAKLFSIVRPDIAAFGQKDAQQVAVVRRIVADLDLPLEVVVVPTVRDADGLALSSRNARLSAAERTVALALPRALEAGMAAHRGGADSVAAAQVILDAEPGLTVDYIAVADYDAPTLVAAVRVGTVRVGTVRLVDNVRLV